jgi:hypothetical protein
VARGVGMACEFTLRPLNHILRIEPVPDGCFAEVLIFRIPRPCGSAPQFLILRAPVCECLTVQAVQICVLLVGNPSDGLDVFNAHE